MYLWVGVTQTAAAKMLHAAAVEKKIGYCAERLASRLQAPGPKAASASKPPVIATFFMNMI
jgi:hypothetical protein